MAAEEEYDIIPSGIIPGQVGKVLTILALPEGRSFTEPEHQHLVATINYEEPSAGIPDQAPAFAGKKARRRPWRSIIVCLCLWMVYSICNLAFSIINPFFPQVVRL